MELVVKIKINAQVIMYALLVPTYVQIFHALASSLMEFHNVITQKLLSHALFQLLLNATIRLVQLIWQVARLV